MNKLLSGNLKGTEIRYFHQRILRVSKHGYIKWEGGLNRRFPVQYYE